MLSIIGLTHRTAPLHMRERLAFGDADLPCALGALAALPRIREALLLSTCNRTEVYLVSEDGVSIMQEVAAALGRLRHADLSAFAPYLSVLVSEDAGRHALRVAAGLESMIVGEAQVLGQVRRAFAAAQEAGTAGPVLNRLMPLAIACGRRVRSETGLGHRSASVPHAALSHAAEILGGLSARRVVVVGAGEMGGLVAKVFSQAGAAITALVNRTPEHARDLAARYGALWLPLDQAGPVLAAADVLIVTAGAEPPLLGCGAFDAAARRPRPLLVIDIAVPRGVASEVGTLPHVSLVDLDALVPTDLPAIPPETLDLAESIVEDALDAFMRWLASRAAVPVIAALHRRAELIVEAELRRARGRLRGLDERQQRAVRGVVEGALRKLLHQPFVRLRARGDDGKVLSLARDLFDLDGPLADVGIQEGKE